jgi:putative NADPH-quinone reductase
MNVLLVYAHPEPKSLNGALESFAVKRLEDAGHSVQVSDLYAMNWKATLDADDCLDRQADARFDPQMDSKRAFENGQQSKDIALEQDKLLWADAVILQFPMWWFSMPAILKGWVERVYAYGFAYGVGEHSDARWGDRYGEGTMAGKRAMLIVTAGGWEAHYGPRGIVPHPTWDSVLPRLRRLATLRDLSDEPNRRSKVCKDSRRARPTSRRPLENPANTISPAECWRVRHPGMHAAT